MRTLQLSVIGSNKDDVIVKQGNSHSLIGAEQWFEIFWARLCTHVRRVQPKSTFSTTVHMRNVFIICKPGFSKLICSAFKKWEDFVVFGSAIKVGKGRPHTLMQKYLF